MSSTLQPQPKPSGDGGRQYVGFEEYIDFQLKLARRGIRGADLLTGGVGAVLLLVAYLFLFVVTDHWVISGGWSQTSRYVLWGGFLAVLGTWLWYKFVRPWSGKITQLYAASQLEHVHPELKSNLLTLVDLQQAGRPVSPVIIEAMERRAAMNLQQMNVDDAVDRHSLTKLSYALLAMVVVLCVYTLASPKSLMSSAWRALFPMANVSLSTRTAILEVKPGDMTVLAHATPDIETTLSGAIPAEVHVLYTTADRRMVDEIVKLQDTGEGVHRYRGRLVGESGNGLMQNLTYRIEAGDAVSPTYSITVRQPPTATVQEIAYDYPAYMGIDDLTQQDSAIDAWEGTNVTVRALTNVPVDSATMLFSDTEDTAVKAEELPMQIADGVHLSVQWPLQFRADGSFPRFYRIQLTRKSETGDELVAVPTLHTQRIRADLPPKLEILHPTEDMELPANGTLPVAYEASDPDFLLKSVVMKFEKDGEALTKQELLFDAPPFEPQTRGQHLLKLEQFAVEPGKTLTFWLEAKDNFEPFADRLGNLTRSPKITITIVDPVTPEQVQQKQAEQQQAADQKIEQAEQAVNPPQELGPDDQPQDPATQRSEEPKPNNPEDPQGENPSNTEQQPMPENGSDSAQEPPEAGTPQNSDPQQGKGKQPQTGQPRKKQLPGSQPQPGQQPPTEPSQDQSEPKSSPGGQPQRNQSPKNKPPSDQTQPGTPPTGQPQDSQTQPNQTPEQQPDKTKPSPNKPQPRRDKAAPDEVLERLLQRQKDQAQKPNEPQQSEEPRPDPSNNDEPEPGQSDSNSTKNADPQQPAPGTSPALPPKQTATPNPAEENTTPMPGSAAEKPSEDKQSDKPGKPQSNDPKTLPKKDKPQSPGASEKPRPGTGPSPEKTPADMPPGNSPDTTGDPANPSPPMKNNPDPSAKPGPDAEPGTEAPMPEDGSTNPADPVKDPATPPSKPDIKKPGVKPPQAKPPTGIDAQTGDPDQKPGETPMPAETPMPGAGPEEPLPTEPSEDNNTPEAPLNPKGPKSETPAADPTPVGDKPPKEDDPAAKPKTPSGDAPDETPMPGDQPGETTNPAENPQPGQPPEVKKPGKQGEKKTPMDQSANPPGQKSNGQRTPDKSTSKDKPTQQPPGQTPPQDTPSSESGSDPGSSSKPGMPGDQPPSEGDPSGTPMPGTPAGDKPKNGNPPSSPSSPGTPGESTPASDQAGESKTREPGAQEKSEDKPKSDDPKKPKSTPAKPKSSETPTEGEPLPATPEEMPPDGAAAEGGQGGGGGPKPEGTETGSLDESEPQDAGQPPQSAPQRKPGAKQKPAPKGQPKKPGAGDKPAEGGEGQGGESPAGGSPQPGSGENPSGPPSAAGSPGPGAINGPPKGGLNPAESGSPSESGPLNSPEEAVDLENRKKATSLAIKQLQDELSRGEVPQELLDDLNYTEEDLDRFLKQLDQNLNDAGDESSPEAQARRRQFEELLKGVNLESEGELKSGGDQARDATQSSGSNRRPTPKKYKSAEEAFRKGLQKSP